MPFTTTELYAVFDADDHTPRGAYDPGNNTAETDLYLILYDTNSDDDDNAQPVVADWEEWANSMAGVCILTSPRADEGPDCPVCLDDMEPALMFVSPCCRRSFHFACFTKCSRCPLCREQQRWWGLL